jgi:hypothetical protein
LLSAVASRQETTSAGRSGGQIYFDLAVRYFQITNVHSRSSYDAMSRLSGQYIRGRRALVVWYKLCQCRRGLG